MDESVSGDYKKNARSLLGFDTIIRFPHLVILRLADVLSFRGLRNVIFQQDNTNSRNTCRLLTYFDADGFRLLH
ncbi:hypothetical protein TNCV_1993591 [Trichonephila clavipes]|nr:hypothetical protein TNCV_1993591 [Trichonephila clavipes]